MRTQLFHDDRRYARPSSLDVFCNSWRTLALAWSSSPGLVLLLVVSAAIAGFLPATLVYVAAKIIDAVIAASTTGSGDTSYAVTLIVLEAGLVAALAGMQRSISHAKSLLNLRLGQRVNELILEKALTLELGQFEDPLLHDQLSRARRAATSKPLSFVTQTVSFAQYLVTLCAYGTLLAQFSPWALLALVFAGLPAFIMEARFSGDAYWLSKWHSADKRMQIYIETLLSREDHVKEVKLFGFGDEFLNRHKRLFRNMYRKDRSLAIRRDLWGFVLGLAGTVVLYIAYIWVATSAIRGVVTLGEMTMYVMAFRQGQSAVSTILTAISDMYDDNLYLAVLYEYLDTPSEQQSGCTVTGSRPKDGIVFSNVTFKYPGADAPALRNIELTLKPGQSLALVGENGSGKTTLIKLLTRLYQPTSGRIILDGVDIGDWDPAALRGRISVIFQDFTRYQMQVGENIGVGDVRYLEDEKRWQIASVKGRANHFIENLPRGYRTQLGKWFADGQELSGGQWQKIALSRAFMRDGADILILDEPTAAMDAEAEAELFEHFRKLATDRMSILISHRFSTVRMADIIAVLDHGLIVEQGGHSELLAKNGRYARLFALQARGYR